MRFPEGSIAGYQSSDVFPFQPRQNLSDLHANPMGSVHQFSIPSRLPVTTQLSPVASLLRYFYIPIISAFTGTTNSSDDIPRRLAQCILLGIRLSVSTFRKTGLTFAMVQAAKNSTTRLVPYKQIATCRTVQHNIIAAHKQRVRIVDCISL